MNTDERGGRRERSHPKSQNQNAIWSNRGSQAKGKAKIQSVFDERAAYRQIEQGIRELNGTTKTLVTLGADDECYMSIGGGESGKYMVNIICDKVSFHDLVVSSKLDAREKLVVGEQEGNYSVRMCVNLETALLAAQTFTVSGQLPISLSGEEEKELAVSSNKI